jgi:hypothetical protein
LRALDPDASVPRVPASQLDARARAAQAMRALCGHDPAARCGLGQRPPSFVGRSACGPRGRWFFFEVLSESAPETERGPLLAFVPADGSDVLATRLPVYGASAGGRPGPVEDVAAVVVDRRRCGVQVRVGSSSDPYDYECGCTATGEHDGVSVRWVEDGALRGFDLGLRRIHPRGEDYERSVELDGRGHVILRQLSGPPPDGLRGRVRVERLIR